MSGGDGSGTCSVAWLAPRLAKVPSLEDRPDRRPPPPEALSDAGEMGEPNAIMAGAVSAKAATLASPSAWLRCTEAPSPSVRAGPPPQSGRGGSEWGARPLSMVGRQLVLVESPLTLPFTRRVGGNGSWVVSVSSELIA